MDSRLMLLTATHCCVCCRNLTDAASVEMGIGPICRNQFFREDLIPTEDQIRMAFGWVQSNAKLFPQEVIKNLKELAEGAVHNRGRVMCNYLIKFASASYNKRDIVLACTPVIAALGFYELSKKLEETRTSAKLWEVSGVWAIQIKEPNSLKSYEFLKLLRKHRISSYGPRVTRGKDRVHYYAKKDSEKTLLDCLSVIYGNCLVEWSGNILSLNKMDASAIRPYAVPAPTLSAPAASAPTSALTPVPAAAAPAVSVAPVTTTPEPVIVVESKGDRIFVQTPYDANYVKGIKNIPGKKPHFDGKGKFKQWSVPATAHRDLWDLLQASFPGQHGTGTKGPFEIPAK